MMEIWLEMMELVEIKVIQAVVKVDERGQHVVKVVLEVLKL